VLLLPQPSNGPLADSRIFDPAAGTYAQAPVLGAADEAYPTGNFWGGTVLPDGRVVLCPYDSRNLLVWDPGLGVAFGRDVALSGFWNHRP
jgi:hypothetical protein